MKNYPILCMAMVIGALHLCIGMEESLAISTEKIVAFGDSFSDNGFDDGHGFRRYSNGKVWVEHLGDLLGAEVDDRAWGGALSGQGNYNTPAKEWSGLLWQVDQYHPDKGTANVLFTVQIGVNDLHDPGTKITPPEVAENLSRALEVLITKGARRILVWNLPASLTFPGYTQEKYQWYDYYAPKLKEAKEHFKQYNAILSEKLGDIQKKHPDANILLFDIEKAMREIQQDFSETATPWLGSYLYPEKGKYLWFDEWHFMTETHQAIAQKVFEAIHDSL